MLVNAAPAEPVEYGETLSVIVIKLNISVSWRSVRGKEFWFIHGWVTLARAGTADAGAVLATCRLK